MVVNGVVGVLGPANGPYGVGLWKNISRGWPTFSRHILYDIGDGSRVKFWQDRWMVKHLLQSAILNCLDLAEIKRLVWLRL